MIIHDHDSIRQLYRDKEITLVEMKKMLLELGDEEENEPEEKVEKKESNPVIENLISSIDKQTKVLSEIQNRPVTVACNHGETSQPISVNIPPTKIVRWEFEIERNESKFITRIIANPVTE